MTPQGCVLSPLLYTLFTHDCSASPLINNNDETEYRTEVRQLTSWCDNHNLVLNIGKTKEMLVDFCRTRQSDSLAFSIGNEMEERVKYFKFVGVIMTEDLSWVGQQLLLCCRKSPMISFLPEETEKYKNPEAAHGEFLPLCHH